MKTITRHLSGTDRVVTYQQFEENDQVLVDGQPGVIKFHRSRNTLAVFLPATPSPASLLGRPVVGQWTDKWSPVDVRAANEHLKNMALYRNWRQLFGDPLIMLNTTKVRVDYEAWVEALQLVYANS